MTKFLENKNLWFYELVMETWVKYSANNLFVCIHMPEDSKKIPSIIGTFLAVIAERSTESICEETEFVISQFRKGEMIKADDGETYLLTEVSLTQEEYSLYGEY